MDLKRSWVPETPSPADPRDTAAFAEGVVFAGQLVPLIVLCGGHPVGLVHSGLIAMLVVVFGEV